MLHHLAVTGPQPQSGRRKAGLVRSWVRWVIDRPYQPEAASERPDEMESRSRR